MQLLGTEDTEAHEAPYEPIIVLGKDNADLFIGLTVKQVVAITRSCLSTDYGHQTVEAPNANRLRIDDLEFFDANGRPVAPVVVAGQLGGLAILVGENHQKEIRDRVREIAQATEQIISMAQQGDFAFGQPPLKLADETVGFDEFIKELASENRQLTGEEHINPGHKKIQSLQSQSSGCTWIRRICGKC